MSEYIPDEIVHGILKRLPVRSLLRLRCVCKRWKQLIDSPYLVLHHLALQKPKTFAAVCDRDSSTFYLLDPRAVGLHDTLPRDSFEEWLGREFWLVGTLHGVVCFYETYCMTSGIILWNPWTRRRLHVPTPKDMHGYRSALYPDSYCGWTYSAFWIDPLTKHFKIVAVKWVHPFGEYEHHDMYGAVYSSSTGDWSEISRAKFKSIAKCLLYGDDPGLVMGKVAYWRGVYRNKAVVISFDFERESFDSVEGPPSVQLCSALRLRNHNGSLSLLYRNTYDMVELYTRQEDGSWVNMFNITFTFAALILNIGTVYDVMELEVNNKILLVAQTTKWELALVDPIAIGWGGVTLKAGNMCMAGGFVESLVFP